MRRILPFFVLATLAIWGTLHAQLPKSGGSSLGGAAGGTNIPSLTDDGTNTTSTHRFLAPNGTGLLPAYSFTNFPTSGIHAATGILAFDLSAVQVGTLQVNGIQFPGYGITGDTGPLIHGMNIREIGVYGLSTGIGNAPTAGVSYLGAAAVGIGNGTAGDFTGTLQAGVRTTDPGCTTTAHIGKQWFDITTTTTAYKVCLNVSGTLTWVTK